MTLEELILYCEAKPAVEHSFPFDEEVMAMKVLDKVFALFSIVREPLQVNLKCDPERAIELREEYEDILPGYHMNKKHWNTIIVGEGMLSLSLIHELIDHSYDLVVSKMTKKQKQVLEDYTE